MGSDLIQAVFLTAVILEINSNIMYLLIHTCVDQIVLKVFLPAALFLRPSDLDQGTIYTYLIQDNSWQ